MDDLVFKNIPAEGFDALSATDRASNPTPSKPNPVPIEEQDEIMTFSLDRQLENLAAQSRGTGPTPPRPGTADPSRMSNTASQPRQQSDAQVQPPIEFPTFAVPVTSEPNDRVSNPTVTRGVQVSADPASSQPFTVEASTRASNPTPTRRGAVPNQPAIAAAESPAQGSFAIDANSRASNPTPTRRGMGGQASAAPVGSGSGIPAAGAPDNRPSNPTPRRRGSVSGEPLAIQVPDVVVGTPFSADASNRASNPTPTRRTSASPQFAQSNPQPITHQEQSAHLPSGNVPVSDSRASNPTPTRRGMVVPNVNGNPDGSPFGDDSSRLSNPSTTRR